MWSLAFSLPVTVCAFFVSGIFMRYGQTFGLFEFGRELVFESRREAIAVSNEVAVARTRQ